MAVRRLQASRLVELAAQLAANPADTDVAATFLIFRAAPDMYAAAGVGVSVADGETVGRALYETGRYAEALPWFERAVGANEQGDVHGRVDHASLGSSLHLVGYCLSEQGKYAEALPWFERAVGANEQGDVHGRVDHASLGLSVAAVSQARKRLEP
jgi:tetratricopeptide (TPR) repeat protein